jgi:DNA-binding response OmpR family regulator
VSSESCKILVIDDDASCAEELCLLLAAAGFPAVSEFSAADGMRRFLSDPDLRVVVSDIRMPDCNGIDLFKLIRGASARGATASLILVTGHTEEHSNTDVVEVGVSTLLLKPLDPIEVVHAVSKAFDLHSAPKCRPEPIPQPEGPRTFRTRKADPLDEISLGDVLVALRQIIREDNAT